MKIRSITYFFDPRWPIERQGFKQAGDFIVAARKAFTEAGYEVQTTRLATVPFPQLVRPIRAKELLNLARALEETGKEWGYDYVSLGPALPEVPESYTVIPEALAGTHNAFFSGVMANPTLGLSLPAVRACAAIIRQVCTITPDGFTNLRFAALANVPAGSPFFPAAYHDRNTPAFALATEAADLAVQAFKDSTRLEEGRLKLIQALEMNAARLEKVAGSLEKTYQVPFQGIDFSMAPFPEESRSVGTAFESLGTPAVGEHGSLTAAVILAEALDRARFKRTGFSGLFLPVLEDVTLAKRAAEGTLTIKDLLLFSAVCGTGLDTVPIPGDVTEEQLTAILVDLAALALRLDKPLTARLMPVPGKKAGDATGFDFAYFANSRVMAVEATSLSTPLFGDETILLKNRRHATS